MRCHSVRVNNTALLVISCEVVISLVLVPLSGNVHAQSQRLPILPTELANPPDGQSFNVGLKAPAPPGIPLATSSDPSYDEQLGMTFTQGFRSMLYNVTAVEQTDPTSGVGPAYLLNGLSNAGYWYQVGLSYNWIYLNGGYDAGFHMNYEVFDSSGNSIFPVVCCGGLDTFSGPVNQGDSVEVNLYFTNSSQVVMLAQDQNTGAYTSEKYSAEGATSFVGSPWSTSNSNGFFTGLMTEWYHPNAYYGNEQKVTYSSSFALSSAWMWIDEYSPPCCSNEQFSNSTSSPVSYVTNPNQLKEFSSNGATEYSDAYEFITGSLSVVTMTLSYAVQEGGSGYSAPVFTYMSNGVQQTATLTTTPTSYLVDANTVWSVANALPGSTVNERWQTDQQTGGTAGSSQTIVFSYYHQYYPSFAYSVQGGGSGYSPPTVSYESFGTTNSVPVGVSVWADAYSHYYFTNPLPGSTASESWYGSGASGTVNGYTPISPTYYHQFEVSAGYSVMGGGSPSPPSLASTQLGQPLQQPLAVTSSAYWLDAGTSWSLTATLEGSTPTERWQASSVTTGEVSVSFSVAPAYYHQFSVTVSYSLIGGGSPTAPVLSETQFGQAYDVPLTGNPATYWLDSGGQWEVPNPLGGSTAQERWSTAQPVNGTILQSMAIQLNYDHQYYFTVDLAPAVGGSVNVQSGWDDAGSTLQVVASANPGWKFEGWTGTGAGSSSATENSTSIIFSNPITESAVFYPGLTIIAGNGGSVSYAVGTAVTTGVVQGGKTFTVYALPGTTATLTESPSSFLYEFTGWSEGASDTTNATSATLNAPTTIKANFSYNYFNIGGIIAAITAVVAVVAVVLGRRGAAERK